MKSTVRVASAALLLLSACGQRAVPPALGGTPAPGFGSDVSCASQGERDCLPPSLPVPGFTGMPFRDVSFEKRCSSLEEFARAFVAAHLQGIRIERAECQEEQFWHGYSLALKLRSGQQVALLGAGVHYRTFEGDDALVLWSREIGEDEDGQLRSLGGTGGSLESFPWSEAGRWNGFHPNMAFFMPTFANFVSGKETRLQIHGRPFEEWVRERAQALEASGLPRQSCDQPRVEKIKFNFSSPDKGTIDFGGIGSDFFRQPGGEVREFLGCSTPACLQEVGAIRFQFWGEWLELSHVVRGGSTGLAERVDSLSVRLSDSPNGGEPSCSAP